MLLYNKNPEFSSLRVFGCLCFPCLYNNHKLQFHSKPCTFLGYSDTYKGYVCLGQDGRVYISRDVKFNELVFPYKENSKSSPEQPSSSETSLLYLPQPIPIPHISSPNPTFHSYDHNSSPHIANSESLPSDSSDSVLLL